VTVWTAAGIAISAMGFGWLYVVSGLMASDVVLRETRLGWIARILDKLPSSVAYPIFLLLWLVFLFGWTVPVMAGVWLLLGASTQSERPPSSGTNCISRERRLE
jgi:hypothetical protein